MVIGKSYARRQQLSGEKKSTLLKNISEYDTCGHHSDKILTIILLFMYHILRKELKKEEF